MRRQAVPSVILLLALSSTLTTAAPLRAQGPSSRILPAATKAYIAIPDWNAFRERWNTTRFGRLLEEEGFKALRSDVRNSGIDGLGLGITTDDLKAVARSEVTWAVVHLSPEAASQLFLVEVTGTEEKANALVGEIATRMEVRGFQAQTQNLGGANVRVYRRPGKDSREPERLVATVLKANMLICATTLPALRDVLERFSEPKNSLSGLPAFVESQRQAKTRLQESPDMVWFMEPLGFLEVQRLGDVRMRPRGPNLLEILQREGFDGIKGLGGVLRFGGDVEVVSHTAIFAPPPFQKAMRMLSFPPGKDFSPPPWMPANLSVCAGIFYDMKSAFDNMAPIFDAVYGEGEEGTFTAVIRDLRDDPDGPRVDMAKEIFEKIGPRATVVLDTPTSAESAGAAVLFAFETMDEKVVADALKRLLENDAEVKRHDFQGTVLWELLEKKKVAKGKQPATMEVHTSKVIAVARGQLLISDDVKFVQKVLSAKASTLHEHSDFAKVAAALRRFATGKDSLYVFSRLEEEFHSPYEMFRRGQLAGGQLIHGQVFQGAMSLLYHSDPSKLPSFERVRPHLGLAGAVGTATENGWLISGVVIKK